MFDLIKWMYDNIQSNESMTIVPMRITGDLEIIFRTSIFAYKMRLSAIQLMSAADYDLFIQQSLEHGLYELRNGESGMNKSYKPLSPS